MGSGRRTQTFMLNESAYSTQNQAASSSNRYLGKSQLGGVIFGCKNSTIKECLSKQLFGLPAQHFSYVKNIDPGLPLFLFNYSGRELHGIFEAASSGQMNINPYGWTTDGSDRTLYPAQVQIRIRQQCHPLPEDQFKPIIMNNYYTQNHFCFELDHAQTSALMSSLLSRPVSSSNFPPQDASKWRPIFRDLPSPDKREKHGGLELPASAAYFSDSHKSNGRLNTANVDACKQVEENEKDLMYTKLKELALNAECPDSTLTQCVEDNAVVNNENLEHKGCLEEQKTSEEQNDDVPINPSDYPSVIAQMIHGMEELKSFRTTQIHRMGYLEQKLVEAETEIQQLKDRCMMLESMSNLHLARVNEREIDSSRELDPHLDELIYIVGGYDEVSWLSNLDAYSPSQDAIKSLKPMNSVRSYGSVAKLGSELYVFGGGDGSSWYDTVESYNPANNQWTLRPSLSKKKGSLAGATLNDKIFALGGGNGSESFSDVEMLDLDVGRWIPTQSMLQKRFALAAVELNGAIYVVGGFDGKDYLKSAERFDPREHSWTRIESMNTMRGSHSLAILNEKLYALGGFDGSAMVPSIEIYDPRMGSWMVGEPMNQSRGYSAAPVLNQSIYVIGGVKSGADIVDTVECYKEGRGWEVINQRVIGKRGFFSAIVL